MTMKTDDLIAVLSQSDTVTKKTLSPAFLMVGMTALFMVLSILVLGVRSDIVNLPAAFYYKTGFLSALAIAAGFYAYRGSKTINNEGGHMPFYVLGGAFGLWLGYDLTHHDVTYFQNMLLTDRAALCVAMTLSYGLVTMGGLTAYFKQYAPADVKKASHTIGLASGLIAGLGYSIHCMMDSPTYVLFAYGLPVLALWGLSRFLLPKYLNW